MSELDQVQQTAETPEQEENAGRKKRKKKKEEVKKPLWMEILSWVLTLVGALAAALLIRAVIFEPVRVDGDSMNDTLTDKEIMLVSKYDYNSIWLSMPWDSDNQAQKAARITIGNPNLLDVVICRYPARGAVNFVKRVVGLPGDTVELREGFLYLNGTQVEAEKELVADEYRVNTLSSGYSFGPYRVPKKGDTLTVSGSGSSLQFLINGEAFNRKNTVLLAKDENGKTLKIYDQNPKEEHGARPSVLVTVIAYDGKEYTSSDWGEIIPTLSGKTFTMDQDYYFLMGDHRNNSNDSRSIGAVERSMIVGHVRRIVFPFNKWRGVK
ncbi:MAG: signal peptidase I [Clostridia bacterium]|nr:signal peptidase I [Clostridia bacterium]MBR4577712.1 signal peptidase I [Clostridia bacterium]